MGHVEEGRERLLDEYSVAVYTSGRVEWNGLDLYLRRNPAAWAELEAIIRARKNIRSPRHFSEPSGVYQTA